MSSFNSPKWSISCSHIYPQKKKKLPNFLQMHATQIWLMAFRLVKRSCEVWITDCADYSIEIWTSKGLLYLMRKRRFLQCFIILFTFCLFPSLPLISCFLLCPLPLLSLQIIQYSDRNNTGVQDINVVFGPVIFENIPPSQSEPLLAYLISTCEFIIT